MSLTRRNLFFMAIALLHYFLARMAMLILYNDQFFSLGFGRILKAFVEGMRFDLSSLAVFFSIPLLLMNFPLKSARHRYWQGFCSWVLYSILICMVGFLIGDLVYFDFVKRHITYELFQMGEGDTNLIVSMIFSSFIIYFLLFLLDATVIFVVWRKILVKPLKKLNSYLKGSIKYFIFFLLLVIAGRGGLGYKPLTIIDAFISGNTDYGNLILNGIFSVSHSSLRGKSVNHHFFPQSEALKIFYPAHSPSDLEYPMQKIKQDARPNNYNLVFVLIESLSFKYVDSFANLSYGVTPNLDLLSTQGLKFENFYAAGQRSVEGIQATLTGIPSIIGMPTIAIGLLANYSKLGEIAQKNGYATIFVTSMKRRSFRLDAIAGSTGFSEFYGKEDTKILLNYPDPQAAKWGWDYETYMLAADKIENAKKPFLAYIITSTTHTPYPKLPPGLGLEKYPHYQNREEGFLNTLNYHDWSIGEFIKRLKKHPWFDQTIFIFTADHALAHYQGGSFRERFHIPLIIYAPKILKPRVIKEVRSQIDLFASVIDILDLKATFSTTGTSVFESVTDSFALVREGSIIGIITEKGFLRHSLRNRLETGSFQGELSERYLTGLEKKLLATDQLTFELLRSNRWAN